MATAPRWLDETEMRAWRGLVEITTDVRAALEAELVAAHGISEGDYGVLVQLSEQAGGRMRMCDLASRLHLSPSGLTRRLDGLVKQGYVEREPSADDRRVSLAVLTPAGLAALEAAAPLHVEGVRRFVFDHLSRAQVEALADAFDAIHDGNQPMCDEARAALAAEAACDEAAANGNAAVAHS